MRRRQGDFGAGPVLSLAGAAGLMLALTVFAHGLVLSLAALIIGPGRPMERRDVAQGSVTGGPPTAVRDDHGRA